MSPSGDRREPVFFEADGLMPNHVYLACAGGREWVAAIFAEARRRYTAAISIGSDGRTICSRVALARW